MGVDLFSVGFVGRVSARRPPYFSLLRQRKVSKRKATRSLGPSAALRATCAARLRWGSAQTRLTPQTRAALIPPPSALLGPARTGFEEKTNPTSTRQGAYLLNLFPPAPSVCAEARKHQRIRARSCLSAASLSETPLGLSTAGCPEAQRRGRRQQGRLFFGYFLLAKQKKVARPPGRDPAQAPTRSTKKCSL